MHRESDVDDSDSIQKCPIINNQNFKSHKTEERKRQKTEVQRRPPGQFFT